MIYKLRFGHDSVNITTKEAAEIINAIENGNSSLFIRGRYIADAPRRVTVVPDPEARARDLETANLALLKELRKLGSSLVEGMDLEKKALPEHVKPYPDDLEPDRKAIEEKFTSIKNDPNRPWKLPSEMKS